MLTIRSWLQAYFDKMGVPFTFSGVEETKTTFNKHETVDILKEEGLPVVRLAIRIISQCQAQGPGQRYDQPAPLLETLESKV